MCRILSMFPASPSATYALRFLMPATARLVTPITPVFAISVLAVLAGYLIRRACFAALGRLFTFTHTTLSEHRLVTDGPYSVVRHASYSGEVLVRGGTICMLLCSGGWISESGAFSSNGASPRLGPETVIVRLAGAAVSFLVVWAFLNTSFLFWRAPREDATLQKKFGSQWEEYRNRVPWMFIPHVC